MKTFTDNAGRTWTVAVNVDAVKRVKDLVGVDFMEFVEGGDLLERVIRNPVVLCDVLYAVCKPEADEKGVSDTDFGRAMGGAAITGAREALLEEIVGFFHEEGPTIRRQADKLLAAYRKVLTAVNLKIDALDEDAAIEAALATSGDSSLTSPASSESTPDP